MVMRRERKKKGEEEGEELGEEEREEGLRRRRKRWLRELFRCHMFFCVSKLWIFRWK